MGFLVALIFRLPAEVGITLLVITSSPGGSYSNWYCSIFNAELALSVTMTAFSTILSCVMLPLNLVLYTRWMYSADVVQSLDWGALFVSLIVVIGGIVCGLMASYWWNTPETAAVMHQRANRLGNCAGLALIVLSFTVSSSDHQAALWDQDAAFYTACALPVVIGLVLAATLATRCQLDKPERVAVSIESCYQNTGIATTVALTMFQTETELATAIGVPLYYGIVESVVIVSFALICWKMGWTKAPASDSLCKMIATSYEVTPAATHQEEDTSIEVVLSCHGNGEKEINMIFSQSSRGDYVVDETTLSDIESQKPLVVLEEPTEFSLTDHEEDDNDNEIVVEAAPEVDPSNTISQKRRRFFGALNATDPEAAAVSTTTTSDSSSSTSDDAAAALPKGARVRRSALSTIRARATGYRPQVPLQSGDDEHDHSLHNPVRDTQLKVVEEGDDEDSRQRIGTQVAATVANRARRKYATVSKISPEKDAKEEASTVQQTSDDTVNVDKEEDDDLSL